jgi:hypothetical protein
MQRSVEREHFETGSNVRQLNFLLKIGYGFFIDSGGELFNGELFDKAQQCYNNVLVLHSV